MAARRKQFRGSVGPKSLIDTTSGGTLKMRAIGTRSGPTRQNRLRLGRTAVSQDTGRGSVSGPGIKRSGAVMLLRKNKPKASKIGGAKGEWRRVEGGWKRRRFTAAQRKTFRSRKSPSTQNNGPR